MATGEPKAGKSGKKVVLGLLAIMFGVFAVLVFLALWNNGGVGDGAANPRVVPKVGSGGSTSSASSSSSSSSSGGGAAFDGAPVDKLVRDKQVRDELRKRILAGWASGEGETAEAARAGRLPSRDPGDAGLTKDYIQQVIREDFFPMAKGCYEELLRKSDAAGGKVFAKFKIVGDEKVGGILDDVEIETEGGLGDEKFVTCMRESLSSIAFEAPPKKGWVTVTYPILLSPDDPPDN